MENNQTVKSMDIFGLPELTLAEEEAMWCHSDSENGSDDSEDGSDYTKDGSEYSSSVGDLCGKTPMLPCLVDLRPTLESAVQVEALPDSGTTISIISEEFARQIGVRILRTSRKLIVPTGAEAELVGQAIIFVKVKKVAVKRLRVLVEKNGQDELLICYKDLIILRVLAVNFPNQVTQKNAALLPHPHGDSSFPPFLTCTLKFATGDEKSWVYATVEAVPDSGCSGFTSISDDFASRCGIKVSPTSIKCTDSEVSGQATISIKIKDQLKEIQRRVSVSNITKDMLLSWTDLISLGVLSSNFPSPTPE